MNRIKIQVLGSSYVISTPEGEDYVRSLAKEVDEAAGQFLQAGNLSANDALVLCALGYADRYRKAEENADHLREQVTSYLEDASRARIEADEARKEIERLNRELDELANG